ncbi:MAG: cysteine--tRNA ligase, partial [Acidimicrobiia bacterium]|nr:cysteine--tRNA ligase [Acidimicrobiia bacterium]
GGTDLIFPHHENEIAQSEAATGEPFARYWLHNGMLNLSGEKMAKSTGHLITLNEALSTWDPMAIRLFFLRTHYRKPLDFNESALADAEASLGRLRGFGRRVGRLESVSPDQEVLRAFRAHMDDDLDIAGALSVVFETVRAANAQLDAGEDASALAAAFIQMLDVLGLQLDGDETADVDITDLAASVSVVATTVDDLLVARDRARADRDFALADRIRDGLVEIGITIEDTADGTRWHRD